MNIRAEVAATVRAALAVLGIVRAPQPTTFDRGGCYGCLTGVHRR